MTVALRPETADDAPFRLALFRASRPPHEGLDGVEPALAEALLRHQVLGQDASYRAAYPAARFAIVEAGDAPVGRLVTHLGAARLTLVDLALLPQWRGRGLGTHLLREVQAKAQDAGLPLVLTVTQSNSAARRLYQRLGFAITANCPPHDDMAWAPAGLQAAACGAR